MLFLFLLTLMNAGLDQKGVVLVHRLSIAGLPVNLLDGTLALGVFAALVGPFVFSRFQTPAVHPAFRATLILFFLALIAGMIGAMREGPPRYVLANELRNVTALPLCMLVGYQCLKTPRSSVVFAYINVAAGLLCASLILFFFLGRSAEVGNQMEVDNIRVIQYVSWYAGLGAALLLFTTLDRKSRMFPLPLTVAMIGFMFVGQFGTLSRSDWVSALGAIFAIPFLLPRARRGVRIVGFILAIPVLMGSLWIGTYAASKAMGRDLTGRLTDRFMSLLPGGSGEDSYRSGKAWDTRVPGLVREFKLWTESPIIGNGFGYVTARGYDMEGIGFNHNVWVAESAVMGVFGLAAYLTPVLAIIVVGRRMVREAVDKGSVLVGVLGVTMGVYCLITGASTMSFNVQRGAIALGVVAGVVLRARAMQLTVLRENLHYADAGFGCDEFPVGTSFEDDGGTRWRGDPPAYGDQPT